MSENMTVATAIGKIILIGEHSVVYKKPAIAVPFNSAKIQTTIKKGRKGITLNSLLYNGPILKAPENIIGLTTVIKKVLKTFSKESVDLQIIVESSIPAERGMGSSAAVVAATVRALYKYFNQELDNKTLTNFVNISEKIVHGNPSGIDTAIVVEEKGLYYIKDLPLEEFEVSLDAHLIVSDTGEKGNTKFAVSKVKEFLDDNELLGIKAIDELKDLTIKAKSNILKNDPVALGLNMNRAQILLTSLGVSNNTIDNLNKVALESGALGSKLTGGGLGGCVITLCASRKQARKISKALLNNGAKNTWIMDMNSNRKDKDES